MQTPYQKNDIISLQIVDMAESGEGIGKIDSLVFFVKNAVVGDYVNAIVTKPTKNIIYAKALEIITPSPHRVNSPCEVSKLCGGCTLLNLDYDEEIKIKENNFFKKLKSIAHLSEENINKIYKGFKKCAHPLHYRNKIQLPLSIRDSHIISGFYKKGTHDIIETNTCPVSFEGADEIINHIKNCIAKFPIDKNKNEKLIYDETTNEGIFREIFLRTGNTSGEVCVTLIVNDKNYKEKIDNYKSLANNMIEEYRRGELSSRRGAEQSSELFRKSPLVKTVTLNINTKNNNVLFGNENIILYGDGYIEDTILDTKFHISPQSFYQVNKYMTEVLYKTGIDFIKEENIDLKNINALDLYCGIGTISLIFAPLVNHITGIEIVKEAINNANENKELNNILNADFYVFDAEKLTNDYFKNLNIESLDLIIVDPPRKGLTESLINTIKNLNPKYILYISCDQGTLCRDLNLFHIGEPSSCRGEFNNRRGELASPLIPSYIPQKITCVDMFPHTLHTETVVLLKRE